MPTPFVSFDCDAFPFSNDRWDAQTVADLRSRVSGQATPPDYKSALVIGAGTLPFTLDVLPQTIYVADLDETVVKGVIGRTKRVEVCTSWGDYRLKELAGNAKGIAELQIATSTGQVDLRPVIGNVVAATGAIRESLEQAGQVLTYVNLTNVAEYLGRPVVRRATGGNPPTGRSVLATMLSELPLSNDAVICDSLAGLRPQLFDLEEYQHRFGFIEA
jgi:hypothetical protein